MAGDSTYVQYSLETAFSGGPRGTLSISVQDPSDWALDGGGRLTETAGAVYVEACRQHAETGAWPTLIERFF